MSILQWLTRDEDIGRARRAPYRLLEPVAEHRHGEPDTGNMLIQGDNLEALKALLPYYAGRVKCIYIDPPYNTRSAFEHYDDNLEHAQWLAMIYPRLELLRALLSEDGSIWISIDDNEGHYLKVVMDEVFGRNNFVANLAWHKRVSPANDAKYFSADFDHILVYSKNIDIWRPIRLGRSETQLNYYKNPDNDPRGKWNSAAYTCAKTAEERPNLYYPIKNPTTEEQIWPNKARVWAYDPKSHERNVAEGLVYWGKDGRARMPRIKKFLTQTRPVVPRSIWTHDDAGHNQESKLELAKLFPNVASPFSTPKPERLLKRVLDIATSSGDLILDSFLGSGTTAAVAHKMGRRYIGIEMGEHALTYCAPRLQKVVDGEQGGISETVGWKGGGGFSFYRLGVPVFDEEGHINPGVRFTALAAHIWFCETGTPYAAKKKSPLLDVHDGTAYYLLYNGILGDTKPGGGNVLTGRVLENLPKHAGQKIIYGELSHLGPDRLKRERIIFKQIPYDVTVR